MITVLIAINSLFAFLLFYNRSYVRSHKAQLITKNNYFDIETDLLYKNDHSITWIDEEELEIEGSYFDVLKIVSIDEKKCRVYVYNDDIESKTTKHLNHDELHKHHPKKNPRTTFTDLLKLKSYTKQHSFTTFLCAQDLSFRNVSMNTLEGHSELPYHPPLI